MIIGLIAGMAGVTALLVLVFRMAVFALPAFLAMAAGRLAFVTGAGLPGAIVVGIVAGVASFFAMRGLIGIVRSPAIRLVLAAVFAAPSAFAGYYVTLTLCGLGGAGGVWRMIFAGAGALAIGAVAIAKLLGRPSDAGTVIGGPSRMRLSSGGAR